MPSIYDFNPALNNTDFIIGEDDFADLTINPMPNVDMYYFKSRKKSLITRFVLRRTDMIEKSVSVTLTKNENGKFAPRFDFSIINVTKKALGVYKDGYVDQSQFPVKAKVSIADHESSVAFNKLISYISSINNIEFDNKTYKTVAEDYLENLEQVFKSISKDKVLSALANEYRGKITVKDLNVLFKRKEALVVFEKLLNNDTFFEARRAQIGEHTRPEDVWQRFFNSNQWIFGYGLKLINTESIDEERLEQVTSGANIFGGAGKRVDGLLKTKGYFGSLVFAEIKTDKKDLLLKLPYRKPDVYQVSGEVTGGVAQVQKTAYKAVRGVSNELEKLYEPDGSFTGIDYSTIKPIQILVVGNLSQLTSNGEINTEMLSSFELYRKSNTDVEIITFDELYERAKYIVGD